MHEKDRFARRLCLAVDVRKYSALAPVSHTEVQHAVDLVLERAAASVRLDRGSWLRQERGDGELSLLPPSVSEPRVVDDFVRELDDELRRHNRGRSPEGRLRLRLALHFGVAVASPKGYAGNAPIVVSRILDSAQLHEALEDNGNADLVLALSDSEYEEVVLGGYCSVDPAEFEPCDIEMAAKNFRTRAWIRVLRPGPHASAPAQSAQALAADAGNASAPTKAGSTPDARSAQDETAPADPRTPTPVVRNTFHGTNNVAVAGINLGQVGVPSHDDSRG